MNPLTVKGTYFPFVDALWPNIDRKREVILILVCSWLIALSAQVVIPLQPVPVTGQTLGVLLTGALLGSKRGAITVLAYLFQGAVGFPVFAGGTSGLAKLVGPTGGYLMGFVAAAFVVGWLSEKGWDRRFITMIFSMVIGNGVIYASGLPWLAIFVGWGAVIKLGLAPFVVGDILKIALAAIALPQIWRRVNMRHE
jgi:biotin transport system substrate-specific component